ncbi:MAG: hypothetical protein HZA50_18990 [Planctomycetes bacterium]|nr:hypothetical protein [Planctomycetota bacterium]
MIAVHVTHEAVEKIGGIGAVIAGLMTADAYARKVSRTVLVGPLFNAQGPVDRRLGHSGKVIFSSVDCLRPPEWASKFSHIEQTYDVGIIYGTRMVDDPCSGRVVQAEVLLLDVHHANVQRMNIFKGEMFKKFAIPSDRFENVWDFEQYMRLAEPGLEALKAIGCNGGQEQVVIFSHEYMGMPLALKAVLAGSPNTKTVFYAHEVASVRPIIEDLAGHDTMFYNVLCRASAKGLTLEDVFPQVLGNFKHPLVRAARYCDHVFAVGDYVHSELEFLDPHFKGMTIDLMYNGIPAIQIDLAQKHASRNLMKTYARNLCGFEPTWIFTHVCRPVRSKAAWRDLRVLHEMESLLASRGETAIYFLLGTLGGQRRSQDVRRMEQNYGWPVVHEKGYPDLCGGEESLGDMADYFNKDHKAIRAVLVNQWDWNNNFCGDRMPAQMTFADIRRGTDVEFGMSCYEPFGIAQFEPLSFGAICSPSNICGCMGFARKACGGRRHDNIVESGYLDVPPDVDIPQLLNISIQQRDHVESIEGGRIARIIFDRLPRGDQQMQGLMEDGYALAREMSWEKVVDNYFLPSINKVARS